MRPGKRVEIQRGIPPVRPSIDDPTGDARAWYLERFVDRAAGRGKSLEKESIARTSLPGHQTIMPHALSSGVHDVYGPLLEINRSRPCRSSLITARIVLTHPKDSARTIVHGGRITSDAKQIRSSIKRQPRWMSAQRGEFKMKTWRRRREYCREPADPRLISRISPAHP
jgi:hypothetical protein